MKNIELDGILFVSKTWHELSNEVGRSFTDLQDCLEILSLSEYGNGITNILTFFVCVPYKDKNKEHERFYTKDKGLDIVRQLDYATFSQLNVEDALKMQAQVFFSCLSKSKKQKKNNSKFRFWAFLYRCRKFIQRKKLAVRKKSYLRKNI